MKNYYKVLEVPEDASIFEIKEAYNALVQKYNPNKNRGNRHLEEKFIDVAVAYKTLENRDKRTDYDRVLKSLSLSYQNHHDTIAIRREYGPQHYSNKKLIIYLAAALPIIAFILLTYNIIVADNAPKRLPEIADNISTQTDDVLNTTNILLKKEAPKASNTTTRIINRSNTVNKYNNKRIAKNNGNPSNPVVPIIPAGKPHADAKKKTAADRITDSKYALMASKRDVLSIQGTPTVITKYDNSEVWGYGKSTVSFEDDKLTAYNNADGNLLIIPR